MNVKEAKLIHERTRAVLVEILSNLKAPTSASELGVILAKEADVCLPTALKAIRVATTDGKIAECGVKMRTFGKAKVYYRDGVGF